MRLFDAAAGEYDAARPPYPEAVYDLLESRLGGLAGKTVADGGAGTGIVARQLLGRGAVVIPFDPGVGVLRQALGRTPTLPAVIADAAAVPFRSHGVDVACFEQSWHWVDQAAGAEEMARVLRPGGWWAAWWNHPWADTESWFDQYYGCLETLCPSFSRHQRNVDWCSEAVAAQGMFAVPERHIVPWARQVTVEDWMTDLRSHSYIIDMDPPSRAEALRTVQSILRQGFPSGTMTVPYQTRVWMACRP